jgi:alpha/beta hydrolase fold
VLTQPAPGRAAPSFAFIFFNAGVLPRIGPHRLNVKMARALAAAGQTSLRFDLSGQGDSRGGGTGIDFRTQATNDLRQAMDHIEANCGIRRFAIVGYCSGAVNAFSAAVKDERVCGVLMFDGYWYRSRWTIPVRHWKRFRATSWSNALGGIARRLGLGGRPAPAGGGAAPVGLFDGDASNTNPPREEFVRAIGGLVARRVATHFVYSGSVIDEYSYAGQFRDVFGREAFHAKVRCAFRPDIDHTFVTLDVQRRMVQLVLDWVPEVEQASRPAP